MATLPWYRLTLIRYRCSSGLARASRRQTARVSHTRDGRGVGMRRGVIGEEGGAQVCEREAGRGGCFSLLNCLLSTDSFRASRSFDHDLKRLPGMEEVDMEGCREEFLSRTGKARASREKAD
eukprot:147033-Rhodomonas_salina.2